MYKYNFVLFNPYDNKYKIDRKGYYNICTKDLENNPQIKVVSNPLGNKSKILRYFFGFHNSEKISRRINLPLKHLWYPLYFENDFNLNNPLCFIIINRNLPLEYFKYLKRVYPTCRLVLLHRDLVKVCKRMAPEMLLNPIFDLEMTFDAGESIKYNMPLFDEFESKIDIPLSSSIESDIFFAGKAKDRLPKLLKAYEIFKNAGLNVFFFLTGVDLKDRISLPGIVYSDKNMSYYEMLCHTVNSRCLLEINQAGSIGYTSRFLEAVIYGKPLITNNDYILQSPFYKTGNIQVVNDINDIDPLFVKNKKNVNYNYNGEFSPFRMIERVEEELIKRYGK